MSATAETPEMRELRLAVAAEVRAIMARKQMNGTDVARQLGVEQTWFSRRHQGKVAWSAPELKLVMDILDEDISKVYAAGAAALEAARNTNPCLSESAWTRSERLTGWARKGLELGRRLYPNLIVDPEVNAA